MLRGELRTLYILYVILLVKKSKMQYVDCFYYSDTEHIMLYIILVVRF